MISLAGSHNELNAAVVLEAQDSPKILDIKLRKMLVMPLSREKSDIECMKKRTQTSNP